jgi:hypothetical protein
MSEMRAYTRDELLQLTPAVYLAEGYVDAEGAVRPELQSSYATAAATQLLAAELSPQELALTVEGVLQILPLTEGSAEDRLHAALQESLLIVARAIRQANNGGLVNWLNECMIAVKSEADLDGFIAHIQAVRRLYALMVQSLPDSSGADSSGPDSSGPDSSGSPQED